MHRACVVSDLVSRVKNVNSNHYYNCIIGLLLMKTNALRFLTRFLLFQSEEPAPMMAE